MASHFKLKGINSSGEEVIGDSLSLTGNSQFKVFPVSKNRGQTSIRESAVVRISGKNHPILLHHKASDTVDPEPSTVKWSFITDIYSSDDTAVQGSDLREQDYGFIMASSGKTSSPDSFGQNSKILISKTYTTKEALLNGVGDFSDPTSGTEYLQNTYNMTLCKFVMFYKELLQGGIIPDDGGTVESNKERIPCKPEVSSFPSGWVENMYIDYILNFKKDGIETTRNFGTWESFISAWEDIHDHIVEYYDVVFYYILNGWVKTNNSLSSRGSNKITITEVSNHGAKPITLEISQQAGFIKYHIGCVPADSNNYSESSMGGAPYSEWLIPSGQITINNVFNNKLLEYSGITPGDLLNGSCYYTPEFKVRNSLSTRSPYDMYIGHWEGDAIIQALTQKEDGFIHKYQYIGKPFILGMFKEIPEGFDLVGIKPYYKKEDSNDPDLWYTENSKSLLGAQLEDPHKISVHYFNSNNVGLSYYFNFKEGKPYLSGTIGGNKHYSFYLIPLFVLFSNNTLCRAVGQGVNEVQYYISGNSAVTEQEVINRGLFYKYLNYTFDTNSVATQNSRGWVDFYKQEDTNKLVRKNIKQILFLPVLFTDFYLEVDNPFTNDGELGRLWFSPNDLPDNSQNEFVLRQLIIKYPSITKID